MKKRIPVPPALATQILFANRRRCCICREPRKPIHIHHIDGDSSNNACENLAVLCLEDHSDVTGNQGFGRNYTPQEVYLYKQGWEAQCTTWHKDSSSKKRAEATEADSDEDEDVEPIESFTKRVNLADNEHYTQELSLEEGDEITFNVGSDESIDFMIMTKRQYNRWSEDGEGRLYFQQSDITSLEDSFEVPKNGTWVLVFCNDSDGHAVVDFDITTWPSE